MYLSFLNECKKISLAFSYLCNHNHDNNIHLKKDTEMKKAIFLALLACITLNVAAQDVDMEGNSCCTSEANVQKNPEFKGGLEALVKYLNKKLNYPDLAKRYGVEGKVVMEFIVDTDGTLKEITAKDCIIERFNTTKFSQETEAEQKALKEQFALLFAKEGARVIRKMPKWTPGSINGEPVRVKYNLPITFKIPDK